MCFCSQTCWKGKKKKKKRGRGKIKPNRRSHTDCANSWCCQDWVVAQCGSNPKIFRKQEMPRGETWEEQIKQPEEHWDCTKIIGILQFTGKNSKGGCEGCLKNHESTNRERWRSWSQRYIWKVSGNILSLGEQKSHATYYSQEAELAERINGLIQPILGIRTRNTNNFLIKLFILR